MRLILKYFFPLLIVCQVLSAQHSLERLPYPINTDEYHETCPVMSYSEQYLFYTRVGSPDFIKTLMENGEDKSVTLDESDYHQRLKSIFSIISGSQIANPISSAFNQDIWYSKVVDESLEYPIHPGHPLNNALPNSICSNYDKDNSFIVVNEFDEDGGMAAGFSKVKLNTDGSFTFPVPIEIKDLRHKGSDINLAMTTDAQHIFLAMNGYDTFGDQDLYVSVKLLDNFYSKPVRLGDNINTKYREATPYISQDRTKLYFASNRPGGIGGMDIYYSERLDYSYQNWSDPILLGQPINSKMDDSYPYVALDGDLIYFTTNRDGTSDIYKAKLIRDSLLHKPIKVNLVAINGVTNTPMTAIINWGEAYEDGYDDFFNTRDGKLQYIFKSNKPMKFEAENRTIKSNIQILDPQELAMEGIEEVELLLFMEKSDQKIVIRKNKSEESLTPQITGIEKELIDNRKVVLKTIKFVRSKADVLAESFPALEELAKILARRPDLRIRVEGHTDNRGDKELLMELSQKRADAIKVILVSRGAKPSQIETKGLGDTRPLNANRNEQEKQENRRVEIRILDQE